MVQTDRAGRLVRWWAVALGALFGAPCRHLLGTAVTARFGRDRSWGTLSVNLLGSAAAGLLAGLSADYVTDTVVALVGVGFLGAFTTASTFAVEVLDLAESGRRTDAVLLVAVTVVLGLALAGGAFVVGRSVT